MLEWHLGGGLNNWEKQNYFPVVLRSFFGGRQKKASHASIKAEFFVFFFVPSERTTSFGHKQICLQTALNGLSLEK